MTSEETTTKATLREQMRSALAAMSPSDRHARSAAACARLIDLREFRDAEVLMFYMPLASEVDLTPAAVRCFQAGQRVCVPRVDWERRDMAPVEVTSFDDHVMETDEHGIRTPREGRPILPGLIDVVLVPGLAFDHQGHRLGRGGGYFDRFLKRLRRGACAIGLAFDGQVVESVPVDDSDVSVHIVVTDRRTIRPRRAAAARKM